MSFKSTGTTILKGISEAVDPSTEVVYQENPDFNYVKSNNFSYGIVVVGEPPYAETSGDNLNLTIPLQGQYTLHNVCANIKCVVVLISGRPLVMMPHLEQVNALVAAWLPGSEGQGVADVLFGDYGFSGKLPRTWFKTVEQLPMNVGDPNYDPLYPIGYGLTTQPTNHTNNHVGEVVFVDDIPAPGNCLYGAFVYSTEPLARRVKTEEHKMQSHYKKLIIETIPSGCRYTETCRLGSEPCRG
ncbi:hypothetical protein V6N13_119256 [Hibiscus sabdariffa]